MRVFNMGVGLGRGWTKGKAALAFKAMNGFRILSAGVVLGLGWLVLLLVYFSFLPGWRSLDFLIFPGQIERALARWDDGDIAYHRWGTLWLDMIFPALYGVVLTAVVRRYWQGRRQVLLLVLTWLAVIADYVENVYTLQLLAGENAVWPHLVATWVKFIAITWPMDVGLIYWWREVRILRRA